VAAFWCCLLLFIALTIIALAVTLDLLLFWSLFCCLRFSHLYIAAVFTCQVAYHFYIALAENICEILRHKLHYIATLAISNTHLLVHDVVGNKIACYIGGLSIFNSSVFK
jgi:hypothetical protein